MANGDQTPDRLMKYVSLGAQILLSCMFIYGYFWILHELMSGDVKIPPDLHDVLLSVIGILTASVLLIMNFWFSSSRSSQAKDEKV